MLSAHPYIGVNEVNFGFNFIFIVKGVLYICSNYDTLGNLGTFLIVFLHFATGMSIL